MQQGVAPLTWLLAPPLRWELPRQLCLRLQSQSL
jgi:hypothetical protein